MGFAEDIQKFIKKTENKSTALLRNVCKEMATKIAERTGVDTGNLLGNYRIGINTIGSNPGFLPGPSAWVGKVKDETIAERNRQRALKFFKRNLQEHLARLALFDTFYMDTDVPYADKVEYIGWKKTPPYRMFGRTIVEFEQIVKKKAAELKDV